MNCTPTLIFNILNSAFICDLNKIFESFFTMKPLGVETGLGLAICQRIVEEAGGNIKVESHLVDGSLFKLVFPRRMPK